MPSTELSSAIAPLSSQLTIHRFEAYFEIIKNCTAANDLHRIIAKDFVEVNDYYTKQAEEEFLKIEKVVAYSNAVIL